MTSTRPSRAEKVDATTPASRNRVVDFLRAAGAVDESAVWYGVLTTLGSSAVALLISVLVALLVL
uniref:hypothetical protein n=1 Tax=Picosynechococcus sp. (strain ATCC 27264 / PCC 7002 / PR-6) TaxID=32049 RepID=UPI001C3CA737